jgi:hypothetical protein
MMVYCAGAAGAEAAGAGALFQLPLPFRLARRSILTRRRAWSNTKHISSKACFLSHSSSSLSATKDKQYLLDFALDNVLAVLKIAAVLQLL